MTDTAVEVRVDSLLSFSRRVQTELTENVIPNASSIRNRLSGEGAYNPTLDGYTNIPSYEIGQNRTFGVDPRVPWAAAVGTRHLESETSVATLLSYLESGLQAIAAAAEAIAGDYKSAEELNAMDMVSVQSYFAQQGPTSPGMGGAGSGHPTNPL
ncbi:MAG: hypothetical protein JXA67_03720 [Micromonosporaceae bacterium]|nr:hypothetical protein [Micromonosporaceae bacterium]